MTIDSVDARCEDGQIEIGFFQGEENAGTIPVTVAGAVRLRAALDEAIEAACKPEAVTEVWFAEGTTILDENRLTVGTAVTAADAELMAQAPVAVKALREIREIDAAINDAEKVPTGDDYNRVVAVALHALKQGEK